MSEPKITDDNAVGYDFGTKFKLIQVTKSSKKEVRLVASPEENVFWALFDAEDVDFEILADNSKNESDISFGVMIREDSYFIEFVVDRLSSWTLKTLEHNGPHLHFVSQGTDEGKMLVAENASVKEISYEKSSFNCSRISFAVEVGKTHEEYEEEGRLMIKERKKSMKSLEGNEDQEMIQPSLCQDIQLSSLEPRFLSGAAMTDGVMPSFMIARHLPQKEAQLDANSPQPTTMVTSSYDSTDSDYEPDGADDSVRNMADSVGERGVVCFGEKTNQEFQYDFSFVPSKKVKAKPFTIELRMKSN